ncbi:DUF4232 domain-containing protein [Streptomyces sp. NPDC005865]|uniref:DUF4232 domain-containing protein n=1 Tax=Streptomyces sp. NPDC005865 TaxID=3155453 RepID=UPI003408B33E
MTGLPRTLSRALALSATALLLAGCGLSEELDRETNPERRPPAEAAPPGANTQRPTGPTGPTDSARPADPADPANPSGRTPPCPNSGVTMSPGMVTATMGLRAMSVTLTNCGHRVRVVDGYPDIRVRGLDRALFDVSVLKGTEPVTTMDDPGPHRVALKPGERAYTTLVWRYSAVDASTRRGSGVYVEIGPAKGKPRQTVEPDGGLDIGETGMLGTTAWQRSPRSS